MNRSWDFGGADTDWALRKNGGTELGAQIIGVIVSWVSTLGSPPIHVNYHIALEIHAPVMRAHTSGEIMQYT